MKHTTSELFDRMDRICTPRMRESQGYGVHCICRQYSSLRLHVTRLRNMLEPGKENPYSAEHPLYYDDEYMAELNGMPELPINAYDRKTLIGLSERFKVLRNLEQRYSDNHDLSRLDSVREEIDFLNVYLKQRKLDSGLCEKLREIEHQDYEMISAAVNRFHAQIRKRDEELYWLLKAHLRIGIFCVWMDDDPPTPLYPLRL